MGSSFPYPLMCINHQREYSVVISLSNSEESDGGRMEHTPPALPPTPPTRLDAIVASTSPTPALTPSLAATSPPSLPASRPSPVTASGRSRAQRWGRDTPPTGKSGGGAPSLSFKDALLAAIPAVPECSASILPRGPDAEGWQEAESRRSRKAHLREERGLRCRVPVDLHDLCFNCFSQTSSVACNNWTHCFKCRRLGHRAVRCPIFGMAARPAPASRHPTSKHSSTVVWRRKDTGSTVAGGSDGIGGGAALPPPAESGGRRRRRRVRRWRSSAQGEGDPPPPAGAGHPPAVVPADGVQGVAGAGAGPRPRRVIDHSERMDRAEEELCFALSVLMVSDHATISVDGLVAELAYRYDLLGGSIVLHHLRPNELLLVFSSEEDAVRVYNEGRPIHLPLIALHCRRWSRLKDATGVSLPQLVDIEIRGVPAHVWEMETAEHLLDEWCWIRGLHPDTIDRRDYSSFQLSAWCLQPEKIPTAMELVVVEPPAPLVEDDPPLKRALSYDIKITVAPDARRVAGVGAPLAPPPAGHGAGRRRRRDSCSPGSSPRSSGDGSPSRGAAPRPLRHAGPGSDGCGTGVQEASCGAAPHLLQHVGPECDEYGTGVQEVPAGAACSTSLVAAAITAPFIPCNQADVDLLFANASPNHMTPGISESNGLIWSDNVAPLMGSNSASPFVPLDDPVLNTVGMSPAVRSSQDQLFNSLVTASGEASTIKTYFCRGKKKTASMRPDVSLAVCSEQALASVDAVEAITPPPPELAPVRVVGTMMPSPVVHHQDMEVLAPTSIVEDALAPPPAPSRPVCAAVTVAPPLVTPVVAETDSLIMMREGSSSDAQPSQVAPAATPAATSAFIAKVTKPVGVVLQRPPPPKPRKKTLSKDFVPRRSRRVANLPPVSDHKSAVAICRQLQFKNGEDNADFGVEGISEETMGQYVKIFEQTLSHEHVKALAALFGWNAPSCDEVRSMASI
ncbi:hypothetical protein SETIT_4G153600v2 [Setaria italica]|uniref:CCHC-type domain-containing protein n=1 Tax=Setaria italica TaxID=4555 RepID=K3Y2R9_SETIT|nr:hypothetical protein SETIT_4G153600v2 [Setaria italica]